MCPGGVARTCALALVVAGCSGSPTEPSSPTSARPSSPVVVPLSGGAQTVELCGESWPPDTTRAFCTEESLVDATPLQGLPQLTTLELGGTGLADLTPLSKLARPW